MNNEQPKAFGAGTSVNKEYWKSKAASDSSCMFLERGPCLQRAAVVVTEVGQVKQTVTAAWNLGPSLYFPFVSPTSKPESQTIYDVRKFRRQGLQNIQCMCGIVMQNIGICVCVLYFHSQFKIQIRSLIVTWWTGVTRF